MIAVVGIVCGTLLIGWLASIRLARWAVKLSRPLPHLVDYDEAIVKLQGIINGHLLSPRPILAKESIGALETLKAQRDKAHADYEKRKAMLEDEADSTNRPEHVKLEST